MRHGMLYNGWWAHPDLTMQFILYNTINLNMNMVMHRAWDKDTEVQSGSIHWQWGQVFTNGKPINCTKMRRVRDDDAIRLVYTFSAEGKLGFQLLISNWGSKTFKTIHGKIAYSFRSWESTNWDLSLPSVFAQSEKLTNILHILNWKVREKNVTWKVKPWKYKKKIRVHNVYGNRSTHHLWLLLCQREAENL